MKVTKRQLRRIIKEAVSLSKGLYAQKTTYGGWYVEDSSGEHIGLGDMVLNLVDADDTAFFDTESGQDPKSLEAMLAKHDKGVQGGVEKWDSDVFENYYNVNPVKLINRYAYQNNLRPVNWVGEDDDMPSDKLEKQESQTSRDASVEDDGEYDFESYYS